MLTFQVRGGSVISPRSAGPVTAAALPLVAGNGTLELDDLRLIVNEFRLEREEDICEDQRVDGFDVKCRKIELLPRFVRIPLSGDEVGVVDVSLPAGSYKKIKFKAENVDDTVDGAVLLGTIRDEFEDWPARASMIVTGVFQPVTGDGGVPFRVYFNADAKLGLKLDPPAVVDDATRTVVTVTIEPARWFANADGTVIDLSVYDFDRTQSVVKIDGSDFARGFTQIVVN